jgi:hypothetical protein
MLLLVALLMVAMPASITLSDTSIKGDEYLISEGKSNQVNPMIYGKYAAWFQVRLNYWGYVVMLKDLSTGTVTALSNSETHLPIPYASDATKIFLNDKYCWWHSFGLSNFYDYKISVYDIASKKTYEFGDSTAQLINPVVVKDHLFYLRKVDSTKTLELYMVKIGSSNSPKKVYTYDTQTWGYSYQCGDVAGDQVVWTDKNDVYMYDVNKSKVIQITKTAETEYYPIIQNGYIFYNKLTWKAGALVYTIYAYDIKNEVSFQLNVKDGAHWQRPSYNPTSNHFIFTQQYADKGSTVYVLCLYDIKQRITKEVQRFPAMPVINSQCASKDFLVWFDGSTGNNNLKLYNYRSNEIFTVNSTVTPGTPIRIDGRTLIWIDSRNGKPDIYGKDIKISISN